MGLHTCSTCPDAEGAIFSSFSQISFLDSYPYDRRCLAPLFFGSHTSTTVPMPRVRLVIDLDNVFACGGYDPSSIKHHTGDRIIVCIRVVDGSCSKIPYLYGFRISGLL